LKGFSRRFLLVVVDTPGIRLAAIAAISWVAKAVGAIEETLNTAKRQLDFSVAARP
jgi:hypothetical protein